MFGNTQYALGGTCDGARVWISGVTPHRSPPLVSLHPLMDGHKILDIVGRETNYLREGYSLACRGTLAILWIALAILWIALAIL